jgi:hypothetical protein
LELYAALKRRSSTIESSESELEKVTDGFGYRVLVEPDSGHAVLPDR